jgi:FkbM family methyltransferase
MPAVNLFKQSSIANIAEAYPLRFFDIGARGGFDTSLWPVAFASEAIGFEPNPDEFKLLSNVGYEVWMNLRYLPVAVSGGNGIKTLNVPSDPVGASLLGPTKLYGPARTKTQFFDVVETHQVETETLDRILVHFDLSPPEYLKLDIEGVELEVLKSSQITLNHTLAVKVEVAYGKHRADQPLASEIMTFLEQQGFALMDFIEPSHWRTTSTVLHPLMDKTPIPYSRGQIAQGDLLYFRRPHLLNTGGVIDVGRHLQLALIAMSFGYFDFAEDIFSAPEVLSEAKRLGCADAQIELERLSKKVGQIEAKKAFWKQIRGFGPFVRRATNLILL